MNDVLTGSERLTCQYVVHWSLTDQSDGVNDPRDKLFKTKIVEQGVLGGWKLPHHRHRSWSVRTGCNYLMSPDLRGVFQQNRPIPEVQRDT